MSGPPRMAVRRQDIQVDLVRRTRFDSRKVSAGGTLDVHPIPRAGHWSAYENAPEVNRLMLEFFSS
jgi:hypothetical protein